MKVQARWILVTVVVSLAVLLSMTFRLPVVRGAADHVRWDLVSLNFATTPITVSAGGHASASANDSSHITLTGSGTFVAPAGGDGTSSATTGGGMWQTFNSSGIPTGSGTYEVTGLVRWEEAPGAFPTAALTDTIDNPAEAHPGLAVLRIEFSDGSHGVLDVSCSLAGTPASVFEGITVSKGFVDYWNRQAPVGGVDGNRTVFHVD